jgi:hypothetical protein
MDYDPASHGAADYRALAAEVIAMNSQPSAQTSEKSPEKPAPRVQVTVTATKPAKLSAARAATAPSPEVAA